MALKRSTILKAVSLAFKAIGNVPEICTFRRVTSAYSPATGQVINTNTDYTIQKGLFTKFENIEVDKVSVLASDSKFIFQHSELSILPNIATDRVVRVSDGKVFNIIRVSQDPAAALYILQLRSPS